MGCLGEVREGKGEGLLQTRCNDKLPSPGLLDLVSFAYNEIPSCEL